MNSVRSRGLRLVSEKMVELFTALLVEFCA